MADKFLCVDGGGSSSQVVVCSVDDFDDRVVDATVGPLSLKSSLRLTVLESFSAMRDLLGAGMSDVSEIRAAALGLSGLDSESDFAAIIEAMVESGLVDNIYISEVPLGKVVESHWGFPILLCSDAVLPLFAEGFGEGAVMISGTGSVAWRIAPDGMTRFGGRGYRVSDEGSGYWIGSEFVREGLHAAERTMAAGEATPEDALLLEDVWKAINPSAARAAGATGAVSAARATGSAGLSVGSSENPTYIKMSEDLTEWAMLHDDPKDFACLAKAALESDAPAANAIAAKAADHLARLATLACGDDYKEIVTSGGILQNQKIRRALAKAAGPTLTQVPTTHPPTYGAYQLLKKS